jgi:hypothetical protein
MRVKLKKKIITENLIGGWNWKNKTSTKVPRTKLEILKKEDLNEKPNIWEIAIEELNWEK